MKELRSEAIREYHLYAVCCTAELESASSKLSNAETGEVNQSTMERCPELSGIRALSFSSSTLRDRNMSYFRAGELELEMKNMIFMSNSVSAAVSYE